MSLKGKIIASIILIGCLVLIGTANQYHKDKKAVERVYSVKNYAFPIFTEFHSQMDLAGDMQYIFQIKDGWEPYTEGPGESMLVHILKDGKPANDWSYIGRNPKTGRVNFYTTYPLVTVPGEGWSRDSYDRCGRAYGASLVSTEFPLEILLADGSKIKIVQ